MACSLCPSACLKVYSHFSQRACVAMMMMSRLGWYQYPSVSKRLIDKAVHSMHKVNCKQN